MNVIFAPLYSLFGFCMNFLMGLLNDQYFLAIIIFVIVTRAIVLPFNMKQQKTTAKSSRIQPKIAKIQKKYANTGNLSQKQIADNRQKMNEEMQALYARENHNPMSMGCGTLIFQMVFLFGIIGIIYYPLSYVLRIPENDLNILTEAVKTLEATSTYPQLMIFSHFAQIKDLVADQLSSPDILTAIDEYRQGMIIGSFDLTRNPTFSFNDVLITIPIFSFLTSFLSSLYSSLSQKKSNPAMAQQGNQMMIMMLMMPFFSLYITFKVPAAVGVYWIISNLVSMLQQIIMTKAYPVKKIMAKSMIEGTIESRSKEEVIKKSADKA